ncbi:glycosyltransferase family 2 protein [Salinimicrobium sediminilitoris]|uniref:glycosyltransferase family 2 protein n=1 Tax=Salinimicrobium sediminilitoris TaxID=2876715 RepID=UPI001E419D89|nr:glycosyltransferase family 2 protein [Salinimicrobium sediminilitoris]MCC8358519.1 glycosyltransferase family 2 protein [Salinimicrobium sediminilitoris]
MDQLKVSVIIPVFNRANLIGETIDSVLSQSYTNWECIVVDDGSTDGIKEILEEYCNKYERIRFFKRPEGKPKGANSCRNFGFEKSSGDYVIWFDSDDLMTANHIEEKVVALEASNADFVIAKTANFEGDELLEPYQYEKKSSGIKAADFVLSKIHWYTYDVILKREVANQISWNEKMKSWQDYNYFCKMLLVTENGIYLDEVLTHRRLHSKSIQKELLASPVNFHNELLENRILTFHDVSAQMDAGTRKEMLYALMNHCFELAKLRSVSKKWFQVLSLVKKHLGFEFATVFGVSLFAGLSSGRGFALLERAKKR